MYIIDQIKNIYNKIIKKSEKKIVEESKTITLDEDVAVLFQFKLKTNSSLEVMVGWDHDQQTDETAFAFGTLLKFLTTGNYDLLISNCLIESLQNDSKINEDFIQEILNVWKQEQIDNMQTELENSPAISPLKTFGESNFGGFGSQT